MRAFEMIIGGRSVPASDGRTIPAVNPYTGEVWATVPHATDDDVDAAVSAAADAFAGTWRGTPGHVRARLLHRLADLIIEHADELSTLESTDNGKIIRETSSQMQFAARNFRFFAGYADKLYGKAIPMDSGSMLDFTIRHPFGVAAILTSWNSPIALLANKVPAALAAGNTVVLKPSEHASATSLEFGRLAREAGFPDGVVNVITGDGPVGAALAAHPGVGKISFTGGTGTGRAIAAAAAQRLVPLTLELGGKSPNIIFDDADLDRAITGAVAGIFGAGGQTCIAGSRLLVQRGVYDQVLDRLVDAAGRIRLGDPLDGSTDMGPIANRPQFDSILASIDAAKASGIPLRCGGGPHEGTGPALFIEPTIFGDVPPGSALAQREVFGPVLATIPFDTEEDAIAIANGTEFGLASGVWTADVGRALRVASAMEAGTVWINTYRASGAQAPFGGTKSSGYGRERGEEALAEYTYVKNVMLDYSTGARDPFRTAGM